MSSEIVKTKPRFIPNIPRELIYGRQDSAVEVVDDRPITRDVIVKTDAKSPAVVEPFVVVNSLKELIQDLRLVARLLCSRSLPAAL